MGLVTFPILSLSNLFADSAVIAKGAVAMNGKQYVILSVSGPPRRDSPWLTIGESWESHKIIGFAENLSSVKLADKSGHITNAPIVSKPIHYLKENSHPKEKLIPLEQLDWAWINSDENEMRNTIVNLPLEITILWLHLDPDDRIKLQNYYRLRGVELGVAFNKNGKRIHVTQERIRDPNQLPSDKNSVAPPKRLTQ